jgi:chromosome segregation ATPase
MVLAGVGPASLAGGASESMDATRGTLARWMETQQIISKEKRNWQMGKEVLEQRIALIENEIADLTRKNDETQQGIDSADDKRREMESESQALKAAAASLEEFIGSAESTTLDLLARLPRPLVTKVKPLRDQIANDQRKSESSLSERYQNVIGILNEINKFNRNILVTSEVQSLADGSQAEVQAVYIGLGQGYYVTPDGLAAAVGHSGPDGWEWTPANNLAGVIAQTVQILQNESVPSYVSLPVEIR